MATTSLWRIDGWLGHVVVYIENPDKTENPAFYEKPISVSPFLCSLSHLLLFPEMQKRGFGLTKTEPPFC